MTVVEPVVMTVIPAPAAPAAALATVAGAIDAPYGGDIHSVRFLTNTLLRKAPRIDADKLGIIRRGTYAGVQASAPAGDGCTSRWIQIAPRGWTCETAIVPSHEAPTVAAAPSLTVEEAGEPVVRGVYGFVRGANVQAFSNRTDAVAGENGRTLAGANSVRASGLVTVDGKRFWQTTQGTLIDESAIVRISPSSFKGVAVEATAKLPAWVRSHTNARDAVKTRSANGKLIGALAPRTIVSVVEESADGKSVRVSATEWVAREDLRVATLAAPPEGTGADEKWFDIDLDQQILIAYEGKQPVYATLVSTGKYGHYTPTIITRISAKHETAHMVSDRDELYSVADVPWTMYYDGHYALHTSYWHDGFGGPRSHGCINLAPRDAKLLYRWSSPDVPPGWTTVYGDEDVPGSLVRVRSSRSPDPKFRGYSQTMRERTNLVASTTSHN